MTKKKTRPRKKIGTFSNSHTKIKLSSRKKKNNKRKTRKNYKIGGVGLFSSDPRFSSGYNNNQYELMNQFIPYKKELIIPGIMWTPFSITFGSNFLGFDMRFYVPPEQQQKYKSYPRYTVDDYLLSSKGKTVKDKTEVYPFMKNMTDNRTALVSYYDAVAIIIEIEDWQITSNSESIIPSLRPPTPTKKSNEYEFKKCKYSIDSPENPDLDALRVSMMRTLFDFSREVNGREIVYMKQGLLPFVITSSTTPLFNAYYNVTPSANPFGVQNLTGIESTEYVKCRFSIILVCFLLDSEINLLTEFQDEIKKRDAAFVKTIVNAKKSVSKKNNTLKEINNYICDINTYILSVCKKHKSKVIRQIDVYYLIISTASWTSFTNLFQRISIWYAYQTMRNPQHEMKVNPIYDPIRFSPNVITKQDLNDTPDKDRPQKIQELNSLLDLNSKTEKTVKEYIYGSNNTFQYSINSAGDLMMINTSIDRINFTPNDDNGNKKYLFAIIYTEKKFNFTQNTFQETAKFRFAMNKQNMKDIVDTFKSDTGLTIEDYFPYWKEIHPIDEPGLTLNDVYNIPFIIYPDTSERIAAFTSSAANTIKTPFIHAYNKTNAAYNTAAQTQRASKLFTTGKNALINNVIQVKNCIFSPV